MSQERERTCNVEQRSRTHCCRATAIRITYSECVSMGTAHFLRMTKSVQTTLEADAHLADG
jgi:hypothetical protein